MDKTKKISYQSLKEKLSDNQLKRIIAGSGGGTYSGPLCCYWEMDLGNGSIHKGCTDNVNIADVFGDIYWTCNTEPAFDYCWGTLELDYCNFML